MRLINRKVEIALDVLQVFALREQNRYTAHELALRLKESELFIHQILKTLKAADWVGSEKGPSGGYFVRLGMEKRSLRQLFSLFHKEWKYNIMKTDHAASERVRQLFMKLLDTCLLDDVFLIAAVVKHHNQEGAL